EIAILIAGLVFLVASFLLRGGGNSESLDMDEEIRKIKAAAVYQESEVRRRVQELAEGAGAGVVSDVEEKLSRVSNDKIMAVDEFSRQVLEKIENNNQEVIFLYDMLQKKEEEMKSTMNKMEQTRRENRELFDRLEELKQAKARVSSRNASKKAGQPAAPGREKSAEPADESRRAAGSPARAQAAKQDAPEPAVVLPDEPALQEDAEEGTEAFPADMAERQEKILALYAQNKSVREISKQLSMGQGAVRLIIDLYGKKQTGSREKN
ncbi:MAG: hypothetical protein K2N94_10330, partial [Lachnospiraceae bacterium]|nr:hypothetical protein [Lachnospiraceae bacterium]